DAAMQSMALDQRRWFERAALKLDRAVGILGSPQERLERPYDRLQSLQLRMARAAADQQRARATRLERAQAGLAHRRPDLAGLRAGLRAQENRLAACAPHLLASRRLRLESALQTLEALNPRKILNRGYAMVRDRSGALVKNALDLNKGDRLANELGQGGADVEVIRPIQ